MKIYQPKDYKGNNLVSEAALASKNYATKDDVELKADKTYVDDELAKKAEATGLEEHTSNNDIHVTTEDKMKWNDTYSTSDIDEKLDTKAEATELEEHTSNNDIHVTTKDKMKWNDTYSTSDIDEKLAKKTNQTDFQTLSDKVDNINELQGIKQTYDPESEHALSGKAVAEAIKDLVSKNDLATKADQTTVDNIATQLENKADQSALDLLEGKVTQLESATIEQTIIGKEQSINAASAKAVAEYVNSAKMELTTQINSKADNAEFQSVSSQVTQNKEKLEELEGTIDKLEQKKASIEALIQTQIALQGKIDENKSNIADINEQIESMSGSIDGQLEELGQQVQSNTTALGAKVEDSVYQAKVTDLESQINDRVTNETFESELGKKADLDTVTTQLNEKATQAELETVKSDLDKKATQESVDTLSGKVTELESADTGFNTRITALENKKDPTVDQEYDAESENAQSGIAVAEGIAEAITPLATKTELTEGLEKKANTETVTELQSTVQTVQSTLDTHTKNETVHIKDTERTKWDAKVDKAQLDSLKDELTQTIESKVGSVFHWKGTVETVDELKSKENPQVGDVWNVTNEGGANYVYSGNTEDNNGWDKLSEDLSGYAKSSELTQHIGDTTKHPSEQKQAEWDKKADDEDITTAVEAAKTELTGKLEEKADKTWVTELTSGLPTDSKVQELSDQLKEKLDTATYEGEKVNFATKTELESKVDADSLDEKLADYALQSSLTTHEENTEAHPPKAKQDEWDKKVSSNDLSNALESYQETFNSQLGLKATAKDLTDHTGNKEIHVEATDKENWNAKLDASVFETEKQTLETKIAGKADLGAYDEEIADLTEQIQGKAEETELQDHIRQTDIHVTSTEKKKWDDKVDTSTLNSAINLAQTTLHGEISKKADSETLTTHTENDAIHVGDGEKAAWNAKADQTWVTSQIGNAKAELTGKIDAKADSADLESLEEQLGSKAESEEVETLSGTVTELNSTVQNIQKQVTALEAGTVVIEDEYDAQSGHAISGKGVADALSSYATSASVSALETQVSGFQTKLDSKAETSKVTELEEQLASKLDDSALTEKLAGYVQSSELNDITQQLDDKASTTDLSEHIADTTIHFAKDEKKNLQTQVTNVEAQLKGKADSSALTDLQDQIEQALTKEEAASLYAKLTDFSELQITVAGKAEDSEVKALTALVQEKADQAGVDAKFEEYTTTEDLNLKLDKKADKDALTKLETTVNGKLDASALESYVQTTDLEEQLATKANSSDITSLREDLDDKVDNATLTQTLGGYVQSTELTKQLATKADKSELSKYALQETVTALDTEVDTNTQAITGLTEELAQKIDDTALTEKLKSYVLQTIFDSHTKNENEGVLHVTEQDKTSWNDKVDEELLQSTVKTGDDAVKEALTKEIAKVENKIPQVDQTYTDEETFGQSVNAQSGKSVQAALTKLEAKLLEEISGGDISLDGYATTQDLTTQKIELEGKITKAQTAAENAQTTADSATTAAAGAQTKAETAQSNLDEHKQDSIKHITAGERQKWNDKVDTSALTQAISTAKDEIKEQYNAAIKQAVGTVFKWKGTVDELTDLDELKETAEVGDVYNVKNEGGANYVWSGPESEEDGTGGWDKLSENLEGFATTNALETHTGNDSLHFKGNEKNDWNTQIQANKTGLADITSQVLSHNESIESLRLKDQQIEADLKTKANSSDLAKYALDADLDELTEQVSTKATSAELTTHTGNNNIHFTNKTEKDNWKSDIDSTKSGLTALQSTVSNHIGDNTLHFDAEEKETWETDISGAKTDITQLKSKTDTTNTELLGLKGTVEGEQKKLKEHIADVTVAHFDTTEKAEMKASIQSLETQMANKVEQSDIESAIADLATQASVTTVSDNLQNLLDSIDNEWDPAESPTSDGPQTGKAVYEAIQEHENKKDIHVTAEEKKAWATTEYVDKKTSGLATSGNIESLSQQVTQAQADLTTHTENTNIHFSSDTEKSEWTGKITKNEKAIETASASISDALNKYETLSEDIEGIQTTLQSKADATELASKADVSVTNQLQTKLTEVEKKIPEVEKTYSGETFAESTNVPTSEVVSDAIDAALTSYATTAGVTEEIGEAVEAAKTEITEELTTQINTKASDADFQAHKKDTNAHFSSETEKTELIKKVDTTASNLETVTAEVQEDKGKIEKLQEKDGELEKSITSNTTEITTLKGKVDGNTGDITKLKSQVSTLEGQVVSVDETWETETSPESGNAQSGVAVKGAIDELSTKLTTQISAVEEQLSDYATTDALESQNTTLTASIKQAQDTANTAKTAAATAQTAAEEAQTTAESANTAASKAQSAIDTHAAKSDIHVSTAEKNKWDAKVESTALTSAIEQAKTDITSAYTTAINEAVGTVFKWKGITESLETLKAIEDPKVGDVYNVTGEGGANYVYSGEDGVEENNGWDKLSENLDGLASTASLNEHKNDSKVHFTNSEKSTWQSDISTAKTDISTLQGSVGTLEGKVESLTSDLEDVTSTLESDYLTKTDAEKIYLKITGAESIYLTISAANTTYLKSTDAAEEYATKAEFATLQASVDENTTNITKKLDITTFNSTISEYTLLTQYQELQKTVEALQTRLQTLESTAVTSEMVRKLAVYAVPSSAPALDARDEDTLYLVGDGAQ